MKERVVLITGGGAGIGKATAERFAESGAKVALCDVNGEAGEAVARTLGPSARFDRVDVTSRAEVRAWVEKVAAWGGSVDVLVNNAGITRDAQLVKLRGGQPVGELSEADFDLVVSVNLKAVFLCTQAVVPAMARQQRGVILNATSAAARNGNFGQTNYVATKCGVVGMTRVWARELGRSGIRVNVVAPGFTATDMVAKMPEKVLEQMRQHTPLGRLGEPRDVANAYFFLASDEASFITGAVLEVDGGLVLGT